MSNKLDYLKKLVGEDRATELLKDADIRKQYLDESGVESKETKPADETPAEPQTKEITPEMQDMIKQVSEFLGMDDLSKEIERLQAGVDLIPVLMNKLDGQQKSVDEAIAEAIAPPITKQYAWQRPSQRKDNVINTTKEADGEDADLELLAKAPPSGDSGWLSQSTGTQPLPVTQ